MKLKNLNCEEIQKTQIVMKLKTQIVMKLKYLNLKNSKAQIVMKL